MYAYVHHMFHSRTLSLAVHFAHGLVPREFRALV